jgi:DNA topoisomerase-1
VTDATCDDCGLPKIRVERGEPFHLCLDPACDPMEEAVSDRFDEVWDCPDCEGDLRVRSAPGRVYLGCENYPDCETTFSFPAGVVVDECDCGLPVFETAAGLGCLDGTCERGGHTASGEAEAQRPNDA